jgi:hypothetical protein
METLTSAAARQTVEDNCLKGFSQNFAEVRPSRLAAL